MNATCVTGILSHVNKVVIMCLLETSNVDCMFNLGHTKASLVSYAIIIIMIRELFTFLLLRLHTSAATGRLAACNPVSLNYYNTQYKCFFFFFFFFLLLLLLFCRIFKVFPRIPSSLG